MAFFPKFMTMLLGAIIFIISFFASGLLGQYTPDQKSPLVYGIVNMVASGLVILLAMQYTFIPKPILYSGATIPRF